MKKLAVITLALWTLICLSAELWAGDKNSKNKPPIGTSPGTRIGSTIGNNPATRWDLPTGAHRQGVRRVFSPGTSPSAAVLGKNGVNIEKRSFITNVNQTVFNVNIQRSYPLYPRRVYWIVYPYSNIPLVPPWFVGRYEGPNSSRVRRDRLVQDFLMEQATGARRMEPEEREQARTALERTLRESANQAFRELAARGLGRLRDSRSLSLLEQVTLNDEDQNVKIAALAAIKEISRNSP